MKYAFRGFNFLFYSSPPYYLFSEKASHKFNSIGGNHYPELGTFDIF